VSDFTDLLRNAWPDTGGGFAEQIERVKELMRIQVKD